MADLLPHQFFKNDSAYPQITAALRFDALNDLRVSPEYPIHCVGVK